MVSLFVTLGFLSGCTLSGEPEEVNEYLNINWRKGQSWGVEYQIWAERRQNQRVEDSSMTKKRVLYRVKENRPGRKQIIASVPKTKTNFYLKFNSSFNLLEVQKINNYSRGSWSKVKQILSNQLGNTAMFDLKRDPLSVAPWFFPDLSVTMNQHQKRLNFRNPDTINNRWFIQRMTRDSDYLVFTMNQTEMNTKLVFRWRVGSPWWQTYRWYHRSRLIAYGKLIKDRK